MDEGEETGTSTSQNGSSFANYKEEVKSDKFQDSRRRDCT